jgi:hypothetical protein
VIEEHRSDGHSKPNGEGNAGPLSGAEDLIVDKFARIFGTGVRHTDQESRALPTQHCAARQFGSTGLSASIFDCAVNPRHHAIVYGIAVLGQGDGPKPWFPTCWITTLVITLVFCFGSMMSDFQRTVSDWPVCITAVGPFILHLAKAERNSSSEKSGHKA